MKRLKIYFSVAVLCATAVCAFAAQDVVEPKVSKKKVKSEITDNLRSNFKFYGFIRTYMPFDTHESYAGTGDLYYWIPKDNLWNEDKSQDLNERSSFRTLAITSRLGVDISGYWIGDNEFGGRIETDFYAGLSGSTGTAQLRLRQAYLTINWHDPDDLRYSILFKAGQAWHPMAADLPDIFALDSAAPFGPFSRTPLLQSDFSIGSNFILTAAAIWQMQYTSMGPSAFDASGKPTAMASSADYIKYGIIPEFYFGLTYRTGGFLARAGVDVSTIKPRSTASVFEDGEAITKKVKDRKTSVLGFLYAQYTRNLFRIKAKTVYGGSGEHMNLESGYAVCNISGNNDLWEYTPINTSSSWMTISYGQKVQGTLLLGYIKNLGTSKDIVGEGDKADASYIFFQKNGSPNINQAYRIEPELAYNVGRLTIGLQYMLTAVQYGDKSYTRRALVYDPSTLHWVANHRVEGMLRFSF